MLAAIISFIGSLPALIKLMGQVLTVVAQIRRAFQKDPIEEIRKDEEKQKEAENAAGNSDNTDGLFGGK